MLEPVSTLTLVYDSVHPNLTGLDKSISDDRFPLLDYLDAENIPYYEKLVSEYDHEIDELVYYPIVLDRFNKEFDYIGNLSEDALLLCRQKKLRVVFYCRDSSEIVEVIRPSLMAQVIRHDITIVDVRVITANKSAEKMPPCVYFPMEELQLRHEHHVGHITKVNKKQRGKKFTCISLNDTPAHKLFASNIDYQSLDDYGYFAYHENLHGEDNPSSDLSPSRQEINKWSTHWTGTDKLMNMFSLRTPILLENVSDYDLYRNAYWNFVLEENFNHKRISVTSNIFLPILNLQPFIVVGSPGTLALLRDLGYKTFGNYVNEEYDSIIDDEERMISVYRLAYQLAILSHEDHMTMMENITPILQHNQAHFLSSKKHRCLNLMRKL